LRRQRSAGFGDRAGISRSAPAVPALVALALALAPIGAHAQLNVLAPTFQNLNGAAVWGSAGYRNTGTAGSLDDRRPIWRGGFAAFYGPFGGRGDTLDAFTQTITDSIDTTLDEGSDDPERKVHRRIRSTHQLQANRKRQGGGKVTLLVGYQHSAFYHFGTRPLTPTVAVGGPLVAALLGPYSLPVAGPRFNGYVGFGGTIVRLTDVGGRIDSLGIELSTERTFAPELTLMLMYTVSPGYRIVFGTSYQYLRFGSVKYRPAQAGDRIPASLLAALPEDLTLGSAHVTLGFSFAASGLIPGK